MCVEQKKTKNFRFVHIVFVVLNNYIGSISLEQYYQDLNFIIYVCIVNRRQREIQFARTCMVRHVPCSIWSICSLLVLLTLLSSERNRFNIC